MNHTKVDRNSSTYLLIRFALQYPWLVFLTIGLSLAGAIFNGVSTTLIVPLILSFLDQRNASIIAQGLPPLISRGLFFLGLSPSSQEVWQLTLVVLLAIFAKNATGFINTLVSSRLSQLLVNAMRKEGLEILLNVDIDFYKHTKVGDIVNQISHEVGRASGAIRIAINIFTIIITILVFVGILLSISWQLTIVSTCLLMLVTLTNQYFVRRAKQYGQVLSEKSAQYSTALLEMLMGIRLIKSVGSEHSERQRIEKFIEQRERADFFSQANFAAIAPINEISGLLAILGIVALGKVFFADSLNSLSTLLLTYLFLLFRLLPFVSQLNGSRSSFANSIPSVEIVAEFLRRDNKPFMTNGSIIYRKLQEGIRLEQVSFAYPGSEEIILDRVNLWIPRGTTVALVGASGAGKSTLADLLPRFYDPISGSISIDGIDLRDFNLRSLRRAMGIVSQDTFLFNDSIANNVAYGTPGADHQDIVEATKRANAYEFIIQLPDGFETVIGDRGVMLSGGQRQRLAIARALLRNPDILILDEATSALDTVSERLVQQAIEELCRDRTTVVIAHRLSTIQNADQIAVLDKGRVVELGSHSELLKHGGYYNKLYSMQFSEDQTTLVQNAVNNAINKTIEATSYEVRTRLTPMIGFLRLIVDDLIDSSQERKELIQESYDSALRVLDTLVYLQNSANGNEPASPNSSISLERDT